MFLCRTDSEDGQVSRLYGLSTFKVSKRCLMMCGGQFAVYRMPCKRVRSHCGINSFHKSHLF